MKPGLGGNDPFWQLPNLLRYVAVFFFRYHQISGQPVGEGAHLTGGAAGRRLTGERERAVAGGRDLAGQKVQIVDQVVTPDPPGVLVKAHSPERGDPDVRVGIELGQLIQFFLGNAGELRH